MFSRRIPALLSLLIMLTILSSQHGMARADPFSDPTPPSLTINTGLKITPGTSGLITSAALRAENGAVIPERLFYTLQSAPQHGALTRDGAPFAAGNAFTQADIDAEKVAYRHDGSTAPQDNFDFTLSHGPLIQRVSVQGDGTPFTSHMDDMMFQLSGDGQYFAFFTPAAVVPMANNGMNNIFVRDLEDSSILLVSHGAADTLSNGDSILPRISQNGRYIVFSSSATNLIAPSSDTASDYHIYRYDRWDQVMEKVDPFPIDLTKTVVRDPSGISADGQVVLYLDESDGSLYVSDLSAHTQQLITRYPNPNQAYWSVLSADGRYVATYEGLLYDRQTGDSQAFPLQNDLFALSGDGRYLVFIGPDELAPGDTNGANDVLVYDRMANTYELISPPSLEPGPWVKNTIAPTISSDGRFVAYSAYQTINQVQNLQVIVYDRVLKNDRIVSTSSTGQPVNNYSLFCSLSDRGERLAFMSTATNLDPLGHSEPGYYLRQLLVSEPQTFRIAIDQNQYYYLPVILTGGQ